MDSVVAANSIVFALIQSVIFLLLIRFLSLYKRQPLSLLALMAVWGAVGATAISLFGNQILGDLLDYTSPELRTVLPGALDAPLVEETSKGIALVIVFALSYLVTKRFGVRLFDGVTDGIVYGAAVGLGFSFTEDILYFFNATSMAVDQGDLLERGLEAYLMRVNFFGPGQLGHAIYTGAFGAGLGLATWSRSWVAKILFPLLGLGVAMLMHAIHNDLLILVLILNFGLDATAEFTSTIASLAQSGQSGQDLLENLYANFPEPIVNTWFFVRVLTVIFNYMFAAAFFLTIGLWVWYQRRVIREELADEMDAGLISHEEWELMPRYWRRFKRYWQVLWSGKVEHWRALRRVHNELVNLALLKRRLRRTGGDWNQVERLRRRIKILKSQKIVELVGEEGATHLASPQNV